MGDGLRTTFKEAPAKLLFLSLLRCFPSIANPGWEIVNVVDKIRDCYMSVSLDLIQCSIAELWD